MDKMNTGLFVTIIALVALAASGIGYIVGSTVSSAPVIMEAGYSTIPLPDGRTIQVPAGQTVTIEYEAKNSQSATKTVKSVSGDSQSGWARGNGPLNESTIAAQTLDLTEGQEKGSAGGIDSILKGASSGTMFLIVFGAIMIVIGVIAIYFKKPKLAVWAFIAGGALIVVGLLVQQYPWMTIVAAAIGIGFIVWYIWKKKQEQKQELALKTVVTAVENSSADTQKEVKANVTAVAATDKNKAVVKDVITTVKKDPEVAAAVTAAAVTAAAVAAAKTTTVAP